MSQTQKVIKYCAMIFAIYLTISIISSIAFCLFSLGLIFFDNDYISENLEATIIENQNIEKIKIDIAGANLLIKTGEKLKVETNNKYIITEEKNNKLTIKEKNHHIFNNESQLIIYIPESLELEDSIIKTGAGKIEIEKIVSNRLELNLGAGALNIHELSIKKNTKINGGAGEIIIDSGSINNLDLDMGVGNVKINTILTGNSTIDTGVGELTFNIEGSKDEYSLDIDKGIGTIKINKEDIGHQEKIGDGDNKIEIDGGIGSININFVKRVVNTSEKKNLKKYIRF